MGRIRLQTATINVSDQLVLQSHKKSVLSYLGHVPNSQVVVSWGKGAPAAEWIGGARLIMAYRRRESQLFMLVGLDGH